MFFVSQGKVRTAARRGGQFCCSSVVNLLQYLCARNYQNTVRLNKVIKKVYFCLTVHISSTMHLINHWSVIAVYAVVTGQSDWLSLNV